MFVQNRTGMGLLYDCPGAAAAAGGGGGGYCCSDGGDGSQSVSDGPHYKRSQVCIAPVADWAAVHFAAGAL